MRRLRVAVAKLKGGDLGGMARDCFRQCGFNGYDGASEGPFSLFERSLELLGRLMAASLLVFAINFDVEAYFLVLSWPLDASWAGFLWIFVALGSILGPPEGRFWCLFEGLSLQLAGSLEDVTTY